MHPCLKVYVNFRLTIDGNKDLRDLLATADSIDDFETVTKLLKERWEPYHQGSKQFDKQVELPLPPWLCQPYVRPPPPKTPLPPKPPVRLDPNMSNKMRKRMLRNPRFKLEKRDPASVKLCHLCQNPMGLKCDFKLCRKCCRAKCHQEDLDCKGHKCFIKTNRLKAKEINHPSIVVEKVSVS